jgi:phosphoglycerate dehydrogenase-like enzyme
MILEPATAGMLFGPTERRAIARLIDLIPPTTMTRQELADRPSVLAEVEVLFGSWSLPRLDDAFYDRAPRLKAIFHAGGMLDVADRARERGVVISTAHVANSLSVADYTLAAILFSLKHGWRLERVMRAERRLIDRNGGTPGCYESTVGLVSLGMCGRLVAHRLEPFDLRVLAYDPFVSPEQARALGTTLVALPELFRRSNVISVHTPLKAATRGMIGGELLASMPAGATFINTARGGLVREAELIEVARARPDLQFVLDVTEPEPPSADSPLWTLPNVELTPHIAGASGGELRRLARYMIEELERLVTGHPLRFAINPTPQLVSPSLRPFISRRIRARADQAAPVSPPTSGR